MGVLYAWMNCFGTLLHKITPGIYIAIKEACIGVIGIQDICHFTFRDIGYYLFYFQGYRILCSISGIRYFLPKKKKKKKTEKNNSKSPFERRELKKKPFIRKSF